MTGVRLACAVRDVRRNTDGDGHGRRPHACQSASAGDPAVVSRRPPLSVRQPLRRAGRQHGALRRRRRRAHAADAARQPDLVVSVPRHDRGAAQPVPLRGARLPGLWPVERRSRLRVHRGRARRRGRSLRRAPGSDRRDTSGAGLGAGRSASWSPRVTPSATGRWWSTPGRGPSRTIASRPCSAVRSAARSVATSSSASTCSPHRSCRTGMPAER